MKCTNLSSNAAKCLFAALKHAQTKLQVLNIMSNNIDDDAGDEIINAIKINTSLSTLKLQRNPVSKESAFGILQALQVNNTLQILRLPRYSKETENKIESLKIQVNQIRSYLKHPVTLRDIKYT